MGCDLPGRIASRIAVSQIIIVSLILPVQSEWYTDPYEPMEISLRPFVGISRSDNDGGAWFFTSHIWYSPGYVLHINGDGELTIPGEYQVITDDTTV